MANIIKNLSGVKQRKVKAATVRIPKGYETLIKKSNNRIDLLAEEIYSAVQFQQFLSQEIQEQSDNVLKSADSHDAIAYAEKCYDLTQKLNIQLKNVLKTAQELTINAQHCQDAFANNY